MTSYTHASFPAPSVSHKVSFPVVFAELITLFFSHDALFSSKRYSSQETSFPASYRVCWRHISIAELLQVKKAVSVEISCGRDEVRDERVIFGVSCVPDHDILFSGVREHQERKSTTKRRNVFFIKSLKYNIIASTYMYTS